MIDGRTDASTDPNIPAGADVDPKEGTWYKGDNPIKGLSIRRIVDYVLPNGEHRPAIVVRVFNATTGYVNLQVFTDGANDIAAFSGPTWSEEFRQKVASGMIWITSVFYDENKAISTWHFGEYVP